MMDLIHYTFIQKSIEIFLIYAVLIVKQYNLYKKNVTLNNVP